MKKLFEILKEAKSGGYAIGHFNISNLEGMRAVVQAAAKLNQPIIIGTSEGERKFIGLHQAVHLVQAFREEFDIPIFLNADHTKSLDNVKAAVDAGYDAILADFSALPYKENSKLTKQAVEYAKSKNPNIIVEGELGYLRGESKLQKEKIEIRPEDLADPKQAQEFVKETKVDMLAPAVGNIHGIALSEPQLDFERIAQIKKSAGVPLVLHGGSGIEPQDIKKAISAGISIVHINTDIRVAYVEALKKSLAQNPDETTPYKLYPLVIEAVQRVVEGKLKIFKL